MHAAHHLRSSLAVLMAVVTLPLCAQGTENAIAAAVMFGTVVVAAVVAGLVVAVGYVFRRRPWQRVVVLVFGAMLCFTSLWIGMQPGSNNDMEFLQLLLGGAGLLFLLLGSFLSPKPVAARRSTP
ncbi:MAG: hypothetical protein IPN85_00235 [Flavobacteriales bacterium]|nr:hypothetical protein [Flavobacteriales bacterium]MBK9286382.1 hypothetical protein [Flavobacteriales bacterium]